VRIRVRRRTEEKADENIIIIAGRKENTSSHNHVIITVFLMVAQAVAPTNITLSIRSHVFIDRIMYRLSTTSYWVLDANKTL